MKIRTQLPIAYKRPLLHLHVTYLVKVESTRVIHTYNHWHYSKITSHKWTPPRTHTIPVGLRTWHFNDIFWCDADRSSFHSRWHMCGYMICVCRCWLTVTKQGTPHNNITFLDFSFADECCFKADVQKVISFRDNLQYLGNQTTSR